MISGLKAALGALHSRLHHYGTGKGSFCIDDCFSLFFLCTLIGEARQDDVHEQQTAALRNASLLIRAQVHHPALQLGSYQKSLSTNSTGKLFLRKKLRLVLFLPRYWAACSVEGCLCVTRGAPRHIQPRRALNVFFMYSTITRKSFLFESMLISMTRCF